MEPECVEPERFTLGELRTWARNWFGKLEGKQISGKRLSEFNLSGLLEDLRVGLQSWTEDLARSDRKLTLEEKLAVLRAVELAELLEVKVGTFNAAFEPDGPGGKNVDPVLQDDLYEVIRVIRTRLGAFLIASTGVEESL